MLSKAIFSALLLAGPVLAIPCQKIRFDFIAASYQGSRKKIRVIFSVCKKNVYYLVMCIYLRIHRVFVINDIDRVRNFDQTEVLR